MNIQSIVDLLLNKKISIYSAINKVKKNPISSSKELISMINNTNSYLRLSKISEVLFAYFSTV